MHAGVSPVLAFAFLCYAVQIRVSLKTSRTLFYMSSKLPISVFIIAHNEVDRITAAIESVRDWVDEVIVVDSGSTDGTMSLAQSLGARVLYHEWQGYGLQKRYAEDQCRNEWLMNLDADEEVTPELAQEIADLFAGGRPLMAGYVLQIRDLLPGETKLAFKAHTNFVLRLYNRKEGRFSDSPVHDSVQIEKALTLTLKAPVLHRSFRHLTHAIDKMNSYSSVQALNLQKKGMRYPVLRLVTEFPLAFFKGYILRMYCLRGRRGFMYAMNYAFTRFIRVAKYLEKRDGR
jgi:glycosyltransferase involved in cell wall biosynthesis